MELNVEDLEIYLSTSSADKEGILLIENDKRKTEEESEETSTLKAHLKGNVLSFYDIVSTKLKHFVVLERVAAHFVEPSSTLPYAFALASGSETFRFSAFSEEDRTEWVQALTSCSHEVLHLRMNTLDERVNVVLNSDYVKLEADLKTKLRTDVGGKGSSNALFQSDPLQPDDDSNVFGALYENLIIKKLKVETGKGLIRCRDHMAEPKITSTLPISLTRIFKENVERTLNQLSNLYYLPPAWDAVRLHHMKRMRELIRRYDVVSAFLNDYSGPPFKASQAKDRTDFDFVPTNLHLQRLSVLNNGDSTTSRWSNYDFLTCGAFTAYAHGYASGGAKKMLKKLRQTLSDDQSWSNCDWATLNLCQNELAEIDSRLKQLKSNLARWTPENEKSFDKMVKFAAEVRALSEQLRQTFDATPQSVDAVEDLLTFYDKYESAKRKRSTSSNNDIGITEDFKLESLESQREDLDAEIACLITKVENLTNLESKNNVDITDKNDTNVTHEREMWKSNAEIAHEREAWCRSLNSTAYVVVERLEKFLRCILDGVLFAFIKTINAPDAVAMYYDVLFRQTVVLSQALTSVSVALLNQVWLMDARDVFDATQAWTTCGALFVVHSYLSCYQDEKGMIEDVAESIRILRKHCSFRVTRSFSSVKSCHPLVDGTWGNIRITLPAPQRIFDALSETLRKGDYFYVVPVFLSVGINYEETIAHRLGDTSLEFDLHEQAFKTYKAFIVRWVKEEYGSGRSIKEVHRLLDELHRQMENKESKNVDILHISTQLCRYLNGSLIICCKSGKDRTAMAVTLEQVFELQRRHDLPESHVQPTLDVVRREGTRLENTLKNIGARRYAFKGIQLNLLPALYRPPKGTYGSVHT